MWQHYQLAPMNGREGQVCHTDRTGTLPAKPGLGMPPCTSDVVESDTQHVKGKPPGMRCFACANTRCADHITPQQHHMPPPPHVLAGNTAPVCCSPAGCVRKEHSALAGVCRQARTRRPGVAAGGGGAEPQGGGSHSGDSQLGVVQLYGTAWIVQLAVQDTAMHSFVQQNLSGPCVHAACALSGVSWLSPAA
jgi:hypothetical protein